MAHESALSIVREILKKLNGDRQVAEGLIISTVVSPTFYNLHDAFAQRCCRVCTIKNCIAADAVYPVE